MVLDRLQVMALKRENKRLKNKLDGARSIIDNLNMRLSDNKDYIERLEFVNGEYFDEIKSLKVRLGELEK